MITNCELRPRRHASPRLLAILGGAAVTAAVAALAAGMPTTAAAASAAASGGGWSAPRVLPGPPDFAGGVSFIALSCASGSDCTAVGSYQVRSGRYRLLAVTERRGVWGKALSIAAPIANVNLGSNPVLSCASAGNCAAGDYYWTRSQRGAFVVSEKNGVWGKAHKVRSAPTAISCPAPGGCTATLNGGYLLTERRGAWGKAFPVPGLAALVQGQSVGFGVISCPSPGNCTAAGYYYDPAVNPRSFVITKRNGIWGRAHLVRSRQGAGLVIAALSCPSAGNCVAGGYAYTPAGGQAAWAVNQRHGAWGTAAFLPGTLKLGTGIGQLDCPAVGACSAAGVFEAGLAGVQPFVSTEQNGTWHNAQTITGVAPGPYPSLHSLSCRAAGNCVLAGSIPVPGGAPGGVQAATAAQVNGHWGPARVLPGVRTLDQGHDSEIVVVFCPPRSRCTAVGRFGLTDHLFVTAQS
jgi:hypothetical protein